MATAHVPTQGSVTGVAAADVVGAADVVVPVRAAGTADSRVAVAHPARAVAAIVTATSDALPYQLT
jgi:hypothetical protein